MIKINIKNNYVKNKKMKVFNKEINNCAECSFLLNDLYCVQLEEDIYNTFDEESEFIFNKQTQIYSNCPFNKPVTKEDIESFGFTTRNEESDFILNFSYLEYKLQYCSSEKTCIIKNHKILFDGKITSKLHLEFILQTLNIIT